MVDTVKSREGDEELEEENEEEEPCEFHEEGADVSSTLFTGIKPNFPY